MLASAMIFVGFISMFIIVLGGGHFFVYFSLVKFLNIETAGAKMWLAGILFILAISFLVSSALAHFSENFLTKALYFSSGLWLGVGFNLFMAFFVSWVIVWISKLVSFQFDHRYLAIVSIIFAIIFSTYGVWNAYHPVIKNITVKMNNLPEAWKNKTVVQLSDVHLGIVLGESFMQNIVQKTNAQNPDIVFITGDLFDGMDGNLNALVGPLNDLQAKDGTYFVTGNHETYLGVSEALTALAKTPVKILNDEVVKVDGMQILGVSYPERGVKKDIAATIKNIAGFTPIEPSILLYHTPTGAQAAKDAGINLQLAGHAHGGSQLFPLQFITRLVYGKYYYGFFQEDNFSIYTSAGIGTWGATMRTNSNPEIVVIHFE